MLYNDSDMTMTACQIVCRVAMSPVPVSLHKVDQARKPSPVWDVWWYVG